MKMMTVSWSEERTILVYEDGESVMAQLTVQEMLECVGRAITEDGCRVNIRFRGDEDPPCPVCGAEPLYSAILEPQEEP